MLNRYSSIKRNRSHYCLAHWLQTKQELLSDPTRPYAVQANRDSVRHRLAAPYHRHSESRRSSRLRICVVSPSSMDNASMKVIGSMVQPSSKYWRMPYDSNFQRQGDYDPRTAPRIPTEMKYRSDSIMLKKLITGFMAAAFLWQDVRYPVGRQHARPSTKPLNEASLPAYSAGRCRRQRCCRRLAWILPDAAASR